MRLLFRFALLAAVAFAAISAGAADDPAPLLKTVAPTGGHVRVRVPFEEQAGTTMQFKALVPKPKGKKGETVEITVGIETLPGTSVVAAKKWQSLGFEVPPNKSVVLPELLIPATQLAPKPTKGRDVEVKFSGLKLEVVEPPANGEKIRGCDLYVCLNDLTKNVDRTFEPRFYFADKFIDMTIATGAVKNSGTGDGTPLEPAITSDADLVVVAGPTVNRGSPVFSYAAVNGLTQYKTPDGKDQVVNVGVSSTTDWTSGILMTIGVARGCGVEMENGKDVVGIGTNFEAMVAKGKLKELRLGFQTGPGLKTQKDLVLKDLVVFIDKNNSGHFLWLGPRFMEDHFKDAVYACGTDGIWRLHGRLKPDLLQDIKTRPKKP